MTSSLPPGAIPSPNIWSHTSVYEIENLATDPHGQLWQAMRAATGGDSWDGRTVLDLGCGTGFHLPRFAETAAEVYGVEPHPDLLGLARRRTRRLEHVTVLQGTAQEIPLPTASVDVVHARWAYFFGPGCEPGIAEVARVVRLGGTALVIDNDPTRSTFGLWFHRGYPSVDAADVAEFWAAHGWRRTPVEMGWRFDAPEDVEAVLRIEFAPEQADEFVAEWRALGSPLTIDYAVNLWHRRF